MLLVQSIVQAQISINSLSDISVGPLDVLLICCLWRIMVIAENQNLPKFIIE